MRLSALILAFFAVSACLGGGRDGGPTGPNPPAPPPPIPSGSTFLWGMIVDEAGVCIAGASVRVMEGQRAGESLTQATPCDAWAYDGGFAFNPVAAGIPMTLRVSAPGYADLDKTVTPSLGPQQAVIFAPSRAVGH